MRFALLLGALTLGGCVVAEQPKQMSCGADGMQDLVGKEASALAAMTFPAGTRIIRPGMPITRDLRPDRLNIDLDDQGRITRVWCG